MDNDCLFCRIVVGEIPATVVHETDTTLAFRDIDPKAPVHVLVIPKAHHTDVVALARADPAGSADLLTAAAAVAEAESVFHGSPSGIDAAAALHGGVGVFREGVHADGFRLLFNTGRYAGQEVFHVHAHVLGGAPLGPMLMPR